MPVTWTADLSVKNEALDAEHQKWIGILNNFYQGLIEKKPKEKLIELVTAMLDYTKYHFASEEKFMKSINYPKLSEHQEKHRAYETKITEFYQRIKEDKMILSLEVTNFLKTWLVNHIKGEDQQYAEFSEKV